MDTTKLTIATYDKVAGKYAQKYFADLSDSPYLDKFLSYLTPGARILDIGCGNGNFAKYIVDKGYGCEGIDLSPGMLKIAQERVPGIKFSMQDMRKLNYANESFDGLLVAYSLIHIPSDQIMSTLKGFHRILKPKGVILLINQQGEPDKIVPEPLQADESIFINFFSEERLAAYLNQADFNVVSQEKALFQDSDFLSNTVIYTLAKK